jgi:hypothetical protein
VRVVLQPDEAAALVAAPAAQRDVSALRDRPLVAVDLRAGDGGADLRALTRLPAVVVGIGPPHAACDVAVDDEDALAVVDDAVRRNPQAAVTLAQLLRLVPQLDPHAGLVAESLAYATLQGGPEFAAWLSTRGTRVRKPEAEPPVLVSRNGDRLAVELNRPRLHNLFNAAMRDALAEALAIASVDDSVRVVELSGRGPSFCAGGDLAEFGTVSDPATAHLIRSTANVAPLFVELADRMHVRVHGAAVGAGCELAAFAGTVEATADAVFRLPEVSMGLVPGAGGTVSVTRRVGRHRAAWLMLTGAPLDAPTAHTWGLVDTLA